jgi:hypothetical protein
MIRETLLLMLFFVTPFDFGWYGGRTRQWLVVELAGT